MSENGFKQTSMINKSNFAFFFNSMHLRTNIF